MSNRQSPEPGTPTTGPVGTGSTSMERSDLASNNPGDAVGFSTTDHSSPRPDSEANRSPNGDGASTSRVACLQERYASSGLSEEASKLLLQSWRLKSSQSYDSHFWKWTRWCSERGRNPISGPASDVVNFLAELHQQGYQSRSLNAFRSAISSARDQVDGVAIGKHPMICRMLKGAIHARPPLPHYTATWDVQTVKQYLESMGSTSSLSLKPLTFKLTMLLALTRPSRAADLASLQLDHWQFCPEGMVSSQHLLPNNLDRASHSKNFSSLPSLTTRISVRWRPSDNMSSQPLPLDPIVSATCLSPWLNHISLCPQQQLPIG